MTITNAMNINTQPSSSASSVVIKIMFQGEIRRFPMVYLLPEQEQDSLGSLFTSLRRVLNHALPGLEGPPGSGNEVFRVQYKDTEGDWVSVLSQPEMDLIAWSKPSNDEHLPQVITLRVTQFHEPKHNNGNKPAVAQQPQPRTVADPIIAVEDQPEPVLATNNDRASASPSPAANGGDGAAENKKELKQQQQQKQKEIKGLMQEATSLKKNGNTDAAIQLLKEGHERFPEHERFVEISAKWQTAVDEAQLKAQQQKFIKDATEFAKEKVFPRAVQILEEAHAQFPQHTRIATLLKKWQTQLEKQQEPKPTPNAATSKPAAAVRIEVKEAAPQAPPETPSSPVNNKVAPPQQQQKTAAPPTQDIPVVVSPKKPAVPQQKQKKQQPLPQNKSTGAESATEIVFQGGEVILLGGRGGGNVQQQFSSPFVVKVPVGATNGTYCLVSDVTKKTLRILKNGKVDQLGGLGPWARFNLTMEPEGCLYTLHHPQTGRYLTASAVTSAKAPAEEGSAITLVSNNVELSSTINPEGAFIDIVQQEQHVNTSTQHSKGSVQADNTPKGAAQPSDAPKNHEMVGTIPSPVAPPSCSATVEGCEPLLVCTTKLEGCPTATAPPQPPTVVSVASKQEDQQMTTDCVHGAGVLKLQEMGFDHCPETQLDALLAKHNGAIAPVVAELLQ
eukprot:TRINITY_DN58226_c0_g1_i1.p1 TRINITY_DN58226_c0_g1~~TRINITY_DN58226_c0_g1_i1.p1  ORF type:complete len:673 (-),score=153.39 TRINITY_DN58226_c0_g1_i1:762-2780(-)